MRLPQRWLTVLASLHEGGFGEAVIAGGALRDTLCGKDVKDVDIFIEAKLGRDREPLTQLMLEQALGVKCPLQEVDDEYAEHFREGELYGVFNVTEKFYGSPDYSDIGELSDPPIQIIALNMPVTLESVVERFDFGICKVSTDGTVDFIHHDFAHDVDNRVFTLRATNRTPEQIERSKKRFERLSEKYQNYTLVLDPNALDVV